MPVNGRVNMPGYLGTQTPAERPRWQPRPQTQTIPGYPGASSRWRVSEDFEVGSGP